MRTSLVRLSVIALMLALGLTMGTASAAPKLTRFDGGGGTMPLCIASSLSEAPTYGSALIGANGVYTLSDDGELTEFRVAEEGRAPNGMFGKPTLIAPSTIDAPACGGSIGDNTNQKSQLCAFEDPDRAPKNKPCATGS